MTKQTSAWLILALFTCLSGPAGAVDVYYGDHERGWFWGEDPPPRADDQEDEEKAEPSTQATPNVASDDPRELIQKFREELEIAKARAILDPTDENLRAFVEKNHQMLEMSTKFAYAFRRTVITNPQFDTTARYPVNTRAVHAWYDAQRELLESRLQKAAKRHGLFFFYKGSCPFCHKFAPVLKAFAEKYGFKIIAVTLDGGRLAEFPNSRFDPSAEARFGIMQVPTVMLADPAAKRLQTIATGFVGPLELERRIYELLEGQPPNPITQTAVKRSPR